MYTFLVFILFTFASCASNRPVATTHTERIEERVMPIPVGADTIEITLCRDTRLERPLTQEGQNPTSEASPQSVQIRRATLAQQESESLNPDGKKSFQSVLSVGDNSNPDGTRSVHSVSSVGSVRNNNSVRISSTRGVNISRHETDTTSTLRITLRPDTVFVPYTNHIRSDTIVVPDRVCQQKLNHSNMTNLFLILILIAIFIIFLRNRMTRK